MSIHNFVHRLNSLITIAPVTEIEEKFKRQGQATGHVSRMQKDYVYLIRVAIEQETQGAVQLMVEEDISSFYQMHEINPDIRLSALFLPSKAACR